MDKVANQLTKNGLKFQSAKLAKFANGACTCSLGDTSVLVSAVSKPPQKATNLGFVALSVDYKQKAAAAGRIPMTHMRRDVGITEKEVLTSRMIDRSIRPGFTTGFSDETQIICNQLAVDGNNDPDILAINGASASLAISDVPWNGPIGAVRVGLLGERPLANPSRKELANSRINLVMSANQTGHVLMIDGSCKEPVLLPDVIKAIKFGIGECRSVVDKINKLQKTVGKPKRPLVLAEMPTQEQIECVIHLAGDKIRDVLTNFTYDKISRDDAMNLVAEETLPQIQEKYPEADSRLLNDAFGHAKKRIYRQIVAETRIRCDGRHLEDLRPISCEVDLYKPLHGSALFQRGQTQVFCSTTFDSPDAAFRTDSMTSLVSGIKEKNFMLHYEFPPYATNEIGRVGSMPGRREIGHGALAEKGIRPLVPENQDMTIRLNCEVLESNGSSSMASVCAGSMSLMDAGVKLKEHVAGVAMGLLTYPSSGGNSNDKLDYSILTDILGFEDYIGDMDFKIAGTKKAITAMQLDVKLENGVNPNIIYEALQRAHTARNTIIKKMDQVISKPREQKKPNHPVMKTISVPQHKVSALMGFGGSNLKKLTATIGVRISACGDSDLTELGASGRDNFVIFAPNQEAMNEAEEYISKIVEKQREPELEFNGIYTATIQELRPNGVMVTLYPSMPPALLPVSQLDIKPVSHPSALKLEIGQQIQVKYFGRDPATGHMRLSRKSLLMSSVSHVHRSIM